MRNRPTFETRAAARVEMKGIDLRASASDGTFEGYGCVFDVVDSYGTHFVRGCFETGGLDERLYALLWMHDPTLPGATFTAREDDHGLFIEGQFDDTQLGQDMRTRAKSGSAPELSVGFIWRDSDPDDESAITSARLVETSQITARMAAVPGAQLSAVRRALQPFADALGVDDVRGDRASVHAREIARARARLLGV